MGYWTDLHITQFISDLIEASRSFILDVLYKKTTKNCDNRQRTYKKFVLFCLFRGPSYKIFISWHFPFKGNEPPNIIIWSCVYKMTESLGDIGAGALLCVKVELVSSVCQYRTTALQNGRYNYDLSINTLRFSSYVFTN